MKPIQQNTGDAKIDRVGQTSNSKHGSNDGATAISRPAPRDLRP